MQYVFSICIQQQCSGNSPCFFQDTAFYYIHIGLVIWIYLSPTIFTILAGNLSQVEIPRKIHICHEPWMPASGLVTEAMKLKRKSIEKYFKKEIYDMYNECAEWTEALNNWNCCSAQDRTIVTVNRGKLWQNMDLSVWFMGWFWSSRMWTCNCRYLTIVFC